MDIEEAKRLLPWYVNGALEQSERRALESELARSAELRRELDEARVMRGAVRDLHAEVPAFRASLFDEALQRIDALEASAAKPKASVSVLRRITSSVARDWRAASSVTRFAMAAQFALIFVMAGFLLRPAFQSDSEYETASATTAVTSDGGPRFDVIFNPEVTTGEVASFLETEGLQIVSGPSAQQRYVVTAPKGVDATRTLERLQSATGVVRFAEAAN